MYITLKDVAAEQPSHCGEKEKKTAAKLARQPHAGDQAANYKVEHLKSEEEESLGTSLIYQLKTKTRIFGIILIHRIMAVNMVIVSIEVDVVPPLPGRDDNDYYLLDSM